MTAPVELERVGCPLGCAAGDDLVVTGRDRLHDEMVRVMRTAVDEVARRKAPTEEKIRDFLQVRLREICPRCGHKVRKAGVYGKDSYFCPHCQPQKRAGLVDWRKTGK